MVHFVPAEAGRLKATRRDWIGLAVLALPCLIYSMDLTVLNLAVPQIAADLKPTSAELLWIVDVYGFMVAGALITMGSLGDRIGRRRVLMIGAAAFGLTSLLAAFATSPAMLIAARAALGLAGATLAPSTLSLVRNMFLDPHERTFAIGIWLACFSVGAAIGPLVGGMLLDHFWWGAVFLPNVPVMLLLIPVAPLLLPEFRDPDADRLDMLSAVLSIAAVLAVVYGIKRIAEDGPAPAHGAAILLGIALAIVFFWRERRLADALIDVELFRAPALRAALVTNVVAIFITFGPFFLVGQYLQLVLGRSALEAGLWTAPSGLLFAAGSVVAPRLLEVARPATVVAGGFAIAAVGFAVLTQLSDATTPWPVFAGMMLFCLGISPIGTITTDLVMTEAPPERAGAASGISETSFELGGALGIAVLGSIMTAVYRHTMEHVGDGSYAVPPDAVIAARDTLGGAAAVATGLPVAAGAELMASARAAFVSAFEVTSAIAAGIALLAALVAARLLRHVGAPR